MLVIHSLYLPKPFIYIGNNIQLETHVIGIFLFCDDVYEEKEIFPSPIWKIGHGAGT